MDRYVFTKMILEILEKEKMEKLDDVVEEMKNIIDYQKEMQKHYEEIGIRGK